MSEPIRTGLVGCGAAGKLHAQAMRESSRIELCMVADTEPRAARMLGERFGLRWTPEPERLFEDPAIEAISLAVPHHLHLEMAQRAARAGKHVLLEKPFTLNVAQARELVEVGRECGVSIVPWLERRFLPFAERAREILAQGALGSIVFTRVSALGL